jgi:hypothetical protein
MAELGDFLSQEAKDVNVTIDMLDYAFVSECKDTKKLRAILDVLNSGKEGYYPDVSFLLSLIHGDGGMVLNFRFRLSLVSLLDTLRKG